MFFDIVLKEDCSRRPLTEEEINEMEKKIWDPDTFAYMVEGDFTQASGLMSHYTAERLNWDLKEIDKLIKSVLNDYRNETKDNCYSVNGVDIYMSR